MPYAIPHKIMIKKHRLAYYLSLKVFHHQFKEYHSGFSNDLNDSFRLLIKEHTWQYNSIIRNAFENMLYILGYTAHKMI